MQRITALNPDTATGKTKDLFNKVQQKLGLVPNMMRTMGTSPAVLNAYLSLSGALAEGKIGAALGEKIALLVAELNECDYCAAAHHFIGEKLVKIDKASIESSRQGKSENSRIQAALTFAKTLVEKQGRFTNADVDNVYLAGFTEGEIGEIVGHVALNIFTNYFNNTARTVVDFPKVELLSGVSHT
ncbi:carboxymuconolactone decarboxylase family protein [Rhodocytophaga rosea]|uniref:Carboxymuconolactone decarboxylase family protein n=1 Tax=Rhodocytophaga rosea TaxID=2704465 RepID=A0A6C0GQ38_9BACT|nr:carboxymuconolactone decarboxylase family protein [Rhodocytophaga rosea]QHT69733.1 carboxymuconolactone decarboxylase family protein [Rhodocytophaga rosea]